MSFDMNPADEDEHGECRHEIQRLKDENSRLKDENSRLNAQLAQQAGREDETPISEWWYAKASNNFEVKWSPAQLWIVDPSGRYGLVVKDKPTVGDRDRLFKALGIQLGET